MVAPALHPIERPNVPVGTIIDGQRKG
jgi:hypothetical protein